MTGTFGSPPNQPMAPLGGGFGPPPNQPMAPPPGGGFGAPAPGFGMPPSVNPTPYDPLTQIDGVNPQIQSQLYELGYTTFEQISKWTRLDVQRIAQYLNVPEQDIRNTWVVQAQSFLFDRYHAL